ncbi:MAG: hypothetical protein E7434_06810 [Ruminococcaceae bacterium]|nr:hypothetical protein [Oscillospiraceae bacterium]
MKKQGNLYLKIITIVLAVFLVVYIVLSMTIDDGVAHTIETVLYCEVGDGETVSGFVVRDEKLLTSTAPIVVCDLTEGERVGSGQAVATGYTNDSARQSRQQLFSLQNQREQLSLAARETDGKNSDVLDAQISDLIVSITAQANAQRMDAMRTYITELEPLILRRCVSGDDADEIQTRIDRIEERIDLLTKQSASGAHSVTVDEPGYFSNAVDGLESVLTPERIMSMDLHDLRNMQDEKSTIPDNAIGKLAVGQKWYFVTKIPEDRPCAVGDYLTVNFSMQGLQELDMKVERITSAQDGECLLVLSSSRHLHRIISLRTQTAEIVFDTYEGLRIPKEALYVVDGLTGVYVLEAGRAEWKTVDKLLQYGDYYLISWDRSNTEGLWPDDEIIITGEHIVDGTVIIK